MLTIMGQIMLDKSYFVKLLSKFFFFFSFLTVDTTIYFLEYIEHLLSITHIPWS